MLVFGNCPLFMYYCGVNILISQSIIRACMLFSDLTNEHEATIMNFSDWFSVQVETYYQSGKNFSDQEKFPLPCVYRWIRGTHIPRPIQISLICKIVAIKTFEQKLQDDPNLTEIAHEMIYSDICASVMKLLQKKAIR